MTAAVNRNQQNQAQQAKAADAAQQEKAAQAGEAAKEVTKDVVQEDIVQETVVQETGAEAQKQEAAQVAGSRGVVSAPKLVTAQPENASKAPPALPKVEAPVAKSKKVDFDLIDSEVERILKDVPAMNRMQIAGIVAYVKKCDPAQVLSIEAIAGASVSLWHNLRLIICNESEHFEAVFTAALKVFELSAKGATGELYLYRAVEQMKLSKEDLRAYCDITTMMRVLAPVKSRQVVLATSLKLTRSLRNGLTQDGINRVVGYFESTK